LTGLSNGKLPSPRARGDRSPAVDGTATLIRTVLPANEPIAIEFLLPQRLRDAKSHPMGRASGEYRLNALQRPPPETRLRPKTGRMKMLGTILIIILILLLIGALPRWGYSTGWGYYPTGGVGLLLIIVIILLLIGYI
jgi:Protein of unknown function (DUF3309)